MSRIRDPARDEAYKIYTENKGITNREIAKRLGIDEKKVATWKTRDNWNTTKGKCSTTKKKKEVVRSTTHKKKVKEMAKNLIEEGYTLKEVEERTGISKSTLGNWSAKEKLQQTQMNNLIEFKELHKDKIRENKLMRLRVNQMALEAIQYEIANGVEKGIISKAAMEKLVMNEELEQLIFENDRIDKIIKLELEKDKLELEKEKANPKDELNGGESVTIIDDIGSGADAV